MTPLIKMGHRWIQPAHVTRVHEDGPYTRVFMVDDHSVTVDMPMIDVVSLINDALADTTKYVRIDQP